MLTRRFCHCRTVRSQICELEHSVRCSARTAKHGAFQLCPLMFQGRDGTAFSVRLHAETVSGHLDWTLLKMLTGGDTLAGASLYENTEGFAPSHTLILTTNDRPTLPPTVAFKERLRFVPFNGDFSKSKDFTLEDDLAREAP